MAIIDIQDTPDGIQVGLPDSEYMTHVPRSEAQEALETLARLLGFSLVDREERRSLLALCEEVDEDDNDYDLASTAWGAWQDRCEALASAVNDALKEDA